jgi:hypothetical protein
VNKVSSNESRLFEEYRKYLCLYASLIVIGYFYHLMPVILHFIDANSLDFSVILTSTVIRAHEGRRDAVILNDSYRVSQVSFI